MEIFIIIFGFLFGFAMQYAKLNKFNTITGMAALKDFTMIKTISFAVGFGAILISILVGLDLAEYHTKPLIPLANIMGGIVFGAGMAILGYCPGTLPISLGQGSIDAFIGIIGGLLGGYIYTLTFGFTQPFIEFNMGKVSVFSLLADHPIVFYSLTLLFGFFLMGFAWKLDQSEKKSNRKWLFTGIAFALINSVMILNNVFAKPIGASTAYPYVADSMMGLVENDYFGKIKSSGHFQVLFLFGAFLAGLIPSLLNKEFQLKLINERWSTNQGSSIAKRVLWAFAGGFLLIYGARIAGGCASGHMLSGNMQMSLSSIVFSLFTFLSFVMVGKYFYRNK